MRPPTAPDALAPPTPGWRRLALAALGPVALIVILSRVDRPALLATLREVDPLLLLCAYLTPLPAIGIRALRWRLLLGQPGARWSGREILVHYARAIALGAVTPGRAGELARAAPISGRGVGLPRALASVVLDRLADVVCLVLLASATLPLLGLRLVRTDLLWLGLGGLAVLAAVALALRVAGRQRLRRLLPALSDATPRIGAAGAMACAGLSLASWGITLSASWLYARGLHLPIGYAEMVALAALCSLVAALPISIAGAGTRDATLLLALAPLGVPAPEALALSTLMLSNTLFVGAVCALTFLVRTGAPATPD